MKIAMTKDEVAFVLAKHLSDTFGVVALSFEVDFDTYHAGEFAIWESKKEDKDNDGKS